MAHRHGAESAFDELAAFIYFASVFMYYLLSSWLPHTRHSDFFIIHNQFSNQTSHYLLSRALSGDALRTLMICLLGPGFSFHVLFLSAS
jgi:hypothetical protein